MEQQDKPRVILVDCNDGARERLAHRLQAQGYDVEATSDPGTGADLALRAPPMAVVADLWMPSISGVQVCRLLRSEAATADVPVILRGEADDPKSRFWAERAGAAAYVVKGRMGELARALERAVAESPSSDGFFMQLSGGDRDIRDRIAQHLDAALFESVIAAEVRALASAESFGRLFDLLSQLLSQLTTYRWLGLHSRALERLGLHYHPTLREQARAEALSAFGNSADVPSFVVEDEDASPVTATNPPLLSTVTFAGEEIGRIALSTPRGADGDVSSLLPLVARELGGALRMTMLVEETRLQASTDPLTGLLNRRAFLATMTGEIARCERHGYPLCVVLLDIDHFKTINDRHGHATGDLVLARTAAHLRSVLRKSDLGVRWGGEEFIVALTSTDLPGGEILVERLRRDIAALEISDPTGARIAVTASLGLAMLRPGESLQRLIERADEAMYAAKVGGRNRVVVSRNDAEPSAGPGPTTNPVAGDA